MYYSYTMPAGIVQLASPARAVAVAFQQSSGRRAEADRRWPAVMRTLTRLREHGRRSIRIVDASCGAGELLLHAARRARVLGFVAIEGRGIDRDPAAIARARTAAHAAVDPAIGLTFEVGDAQQALREEADFPADIVLHGDDVAPAVARRAGRAILSERRPVRIAA